MRKIDAVNAYRVLMQATLGACTTEERLQVMGCVRELRVVADEYQRVLDDAMKANRDLAESDAAEYQRVLNATMQPIAEEQVELTARLTPECIAHIGEGLPQATVGDLMWIEDTCGTSCLNDK